MTVKQSFAAALILAATSVGSIWGYGQLQKKNFTLSEASDKISLFKNADYTGTPAPDPVVSFENAAQKAVPAVVHIKTLTKAKQVGNMPNMQDNPFKDFFGPGFEDMFGGRGQMQSPEQRASGSGVIMTADGYIVTNNHVVDGADQLSVTLSNNKTFKGHVVGKDPSSDIAVIKIDGNNLPFLSFANSDNVRLGQAVLAIGYPLNLDVTVTSGIVSAKSRSLGINSRQSKTPMEAFIQTDAAINPGNSGGALVNTNGDLIGINSAIASPTGSYAGYGYAIPSNMVNKVATDIIRYGSAKRAYLGIMFGGDQMSEEDKKKNNVKDGDGVYVMDVAQNSAASAAGIQKGDFITKINGESINSGTEIIEKVGAMRPGDKMNVSYVHNGIERTASVTLKGESGTYAMMKEQAVEQLGASLETLPKQKASQLGIPGGVEVKDLGQGTLAEQTRIREGFIITAVNNQKVTSVDQLKQALMNAGSSAIIAGIYPSNPQREYQYALNDLQ
ncbi:MAG: trypsin-like peptidase domain-containing protein [Candidatus Dadabacteria bacterium]